MTEPGARPLAPWRRLRRKIREVGWLYAAQLLLERQIPENLFGINKLLFSKSDPRIRSAHELRDAEMRIVSAGDPGALAGAEAWPWHLRAAVEEEQNVAVFTREGRTIAYRTFTTGNYDQTNWLRFIIPPDAVRIGYVWVAPELRGREIAVGSRNALARYHAAHGVAWNISSIDALNRNSLRAHEKHGGGYAGGLFYVRLFGLTLVRTDGVFKLGVWGSKRPLEIRIDPTAGDPGAGPGNKPGSSD